MTTFTFNRITPHLASASHYARAMRVAWQHQWFYRNAQWASVRVLSVLRSLELQRPQIRIIEEHLRLLSEGDQRQDHLSHAATRLVMALTLRELEGER